MQPAWLATDPKECSILRGYWPGMTSLVVVYVLGVIVGIVCGDAPPGVRIAHALLWPIGLVAFAITLGVLIGASLIAFPWIAGALLAASVILWALG